MQALLASLLAGESTRVYVAFAATAEGVCALVFDDCTQALEPRLRRTFGHFFQLDAGDPLQLCARLGAYFGGDLEALESTPLLTAPTPMQRRVWDSARAVRPGELTTYASISERLGMPRAQRAVGVCLASNPVPLFVPCHRVVAASGGMGSHPGGLSRKRWLLAHEGVMKPQELGMAKHVRRRLKARDRLLVGFAELLELAPASAG
jgi:methylated-DNA-[protein]-cysteine S-methyltransferase